jgi:uncharacterized hydrophobic protein (TIGR00271 family)
MTTVAESLDELDGVSRVRLVPATRANHALVLAAVRPNAVDPLLGRLRELGIDDDEVVLTRPQVVGGMLTGSAETSLVWADVLSAAWHHARPIGRYLAFMFAAGVIACYGVVEASPILIVGAMAASPDLLPITAIGVGIAGRSPRLIGEAFLTLIIGMAVVSAAAAIFAFGQDQLDLLPSGFSLSSASTALGGLTTVSDETIAVAFVAGVAGMLALETRASSAVGVAVSVTTVPAAAFLGVAFGVGELAQAAGTLRVLGTNVAMMAVGASLALVVQRRLLERHRARGASGAPAIGSGR